METVGLPHLVRNVADNLGVSQKDVKDVIQDFFEAVAEELESGNQVKIGTYVQFKYRYSAPIKKGTMTRNPFDGTTKAHAGRPGQLGVRATALSGLKRSAPGISTKAGKEIAATFKKG